MQDKAAMKQNAVFIEQFSRSRRIGSTSTDFGIHLRQSKGSRDFRAAT